MPFPAIDLSKIRTYSIIHRGSRVSVNSLITPDTPLQPFENTEMGEVAGRIAAARQLGAPVIWMIGGHVVKRGLAPILIDLMERGVITHLASNGAATIHDFEIAMIGQTSEDVAASIEDGSFGMAEETGAFMNEAIRAGARQGIGMGEALGQRIAKDDRFRFREMSLVYNAYRLGIPYTVHIAIGTDIIHQHPLCDFAALGWASGQDFRIFSAAVSRLEGGVFCNFGSAVIGPEVFLKALSIARNLGHTVKIFTTANFDLYPLQDYRTPVKDDNPEYYYRPRKNIINRPTSLGGRGYHIVGDHLATIPNLAALVREILGHKWSEDLTQQQVPGELDPCESLAVITTPAMRRLCQTLDAHPALQHLAGQIIQAYNELFRSVLSGGILYTCQEGDQVRAPTPVDCVQPEPRSVHRDRVEAVPGGDTLVKILRPGLRQAFLGSHPDVAQAGDPVETREARELYLLARPGDALLCLCPEGETDKGVLAASVAQALGLPVVMIANETASRLVDLPGTLVLPLSTGKLPGGPSLVYRTLIDMLSCTLFSNE